MTVVFSEQIAFLINISQVWIQTLPEDLQKITEIGGQGDERDLCWASFSLVKMPLLWDVALLPWAGISILPIVLQIPKMKTMRLSNFKILVLYGVILTWLLFWASVFPSLLLYLGILYLIIPSPFLSQPMLMILDGDDLLNFTSVIGAVKI